MSYFDKFITDGNEKADELAKASFFTRQKFRESDVGRWIRGGEESKTVKQEREEVCAALQQAAYFQSVGKYKDCEELKPKPKEQCFFVYKRRDVTRHRTEWRAAVNKYRSMTCGAARI